MYDISNQPEKMQARYKELPEEITELFEYDTVEQVLRETITEFGLKESDKDILQMEIELVLYLFMSRDGLADRLKESLEVDETRATAIAKKVNDDLFVIVDDVLTYAEAELAGQGEAEGVIPVITAPTNQTPTETPETTPPEPKDESTQVKPLRTFAMDVDMSRAHGYGVSMPNTNDEEDDQPVHSSSQDDILKK